MNVTEINKIILSSRENEDFYAKNISDGRHTFGELYDQRSILFCALCNSHPNLSWKSKNHFDEVNDPMYNDCFIVGINTPKGVVTHHIKQKYWDNFHVTILDNAPKYNGHSDITWLLSLQ